MRSRSDSGVAIAVLGAALHETATFPTHPESLATLQSHLDARWVDEALEASGVGTLRKRRLPAEQVVWLVLGDIAAAGPADGRGREVARPRAARTRRNGDGGLPAA